MTGVQTCALPIYSDDLDYLLELIDAHVSRRCAELEVERQDYRLTRREIREATGWGNTQLHMHLHRLTDLEYLLVHRGRRGQSFVYELLWDGQGADGERDRLPALVRLPEDARPHGPSGRERGVVALGVAVAGALGLEAASRGAGVVTFVESSRRALAALETNLAAYRRAAPDQPPPEVLPVKAEVALQRLAASETQIGRAHV